MSVGCVMSRFIRSELAQTVSRLVLVASAAALLVGCSSDISRFNGEPDAGPFRTSQRFEGSSASSGFASSAPQQVAAAPVSAVQLEWSIGTRDAEDAGQSGVHAAAPTPSRLSPPPQSFLVRASSASALWRTRRCVAGC